MRTSLVSKLARTVVLITLLVATGNAWARPPRAREWFGVLERIDQQTHLLVVSSPKAGQPLEVVWTRETDFIRHRKFDSVGSLKEGASVRVFYRSPLFGRPFVTRVIWING